ncbi:MAG: CBS domain-containing protein, partial [Methylococcales bacterium]|nr:CBS domain-containing protein [Methylococcales bacterium]
FRVNRASMRKNDPITKIMAAELITVQQGQKLSDVRHIIIESNIHHVPIVEGKKLVGLISFTDLMKLNIVISGADERTIDSIVDQQFTIQDIMTTELITIKNTDSVRQASKILAESNFHSLPVIDEQKEIVGIVTMTDLIQYLNDQY